MDLFNGLKFKRFFFLFLRYIISALMFYSFLYSFYYYNDFSGTIGDEWINHYRYSMEGCVTNETGGSTTSFIKFSNNMLVLGGSPYNNNNDYNGTWLGYQIFMTNRYAASEYAPFGFDLYRLSSQIDAESTAQNFPWRIQSQLDIWLVSGTRVTEQWSVYPGYFLFFENGMRGDPDIPYDPVFNPKNISRTGVFTGPLSFLDLSLTRQAHGQFYDLSRTNGNYHSLNYKYNWEGDGYNDLTDGGGNNRVNSNDFIFRITHDGHYVRAYVNPDPDNNDANINEFLLLYKERVYWSNNLHIMLGHEVLNRDVSCQSAEYDYIRIRRAAASSGFRFDDTVYSNHFYRVVMTLSNRVKPYDSGINTVKINLENGFLEFVTVENLFVNCNKRRISAPVSLPGAFSPRIINCIVKPNELILVLDNFLQDDDLLKADFVLHGKDLRLTNAVTSQTLKVFVGGIQYDSLPATFGKSSTCGFMRSRGEGTIEIRPVQTAFAGCNGSEL